MITYILIFVLLLIAELVYFRIADKYNIIDKPNQRSSHSTIVLRGGGVIFLIGAWIWSAFFGFVIIKTEDITRLIFLLVYGVDGCLTIIHRIMLHENLGEAHRKHAYQIMANELKIGHVKVTLLYMAMQLAVSLGFVYLCPNTALCHWMYLIGALAVLAIAYVLFMKKYYHLHEEYLAELGVLN